MSDLSTSVSELRAQFDAAVAAATSAADLQAVRDRFLGRKHGLVTALYGEIASILRSTVMPARVSPAMNCE
jgi:hypothetical protein